MSCLDIGKMGGYVSTSSCSSRSNREGMSPSFLWIDVFRGKRSRRTFSDHITTLQHLSSLPNRIFTNGRSSSLCVFTQQGRKGINQDAMIMWEDFMVEDVTFCGVFDGHGPHGHLAARKVRDTLSMKLSSFRNAFESKRNRSCGSCYNGNLVSEAVDPANDASGEVQVESLWQETFS